MASLTPSSDAEILVHVTAPSRATNDAIYRQLAHAYLAFEPQTRAEVLLTEPQPDGPCSVPVKPPAQPVASSANDFAFPSFAQSFEINSQNISFNSALDNRSSPRLKYTPAAVAGDEVGSSPQESHAGSQVSWYAPPSQISDSYPMPDQSLLQISPTRALMRHIGKPNPRSTDIMASSPSLSAQTKPTPSENPDEVEVSSSLPESAEQESPYVRAVGYLKTNRTIPVTPYLARTTRVLHSSVDSAVLAADESILDITHISSSALTDQAPTPSHRAESEPPLTKRPRVGHLQYSDLVRSSSDTGPIMSSVNSVAEEISHSLEIRPPSPPVGVVDVDPDDLISEKMAKLAQDLSSRYRPTAKREVEAFERGYWLLDCASWSPEDRFNAWVFLNNYIRNGMAGWGTWCRRDNDYHWIRLYCWGHVAKHMYLLLYLASRRLLKHTGASWYGADGEVALEVPSHDKQR